MQDLAGFRALSAPWAALLDHAADHSVSQTFAFAMAAWTHVAGPIGTLEIITIWRGDAPVCVWPLYSRQPGGVRVVRHLGSGSNEEYSGPLLADGSFAARLATLALKTAKSRADVLNIYNVDRTGHLGAAIEADRAWSHKSSIETSVALVGAFTEIEDWRHSKSRNFRQGLKQKRRRLSELGALSFERVRERDRVALFVDWIFERKLTFLDRRGITRSWIRRPQSRALYRTLLMEAEGDRGAMAFALRLEERIVAGCICLVGRSMEFLMISHDGTYDAFSPGTLLLEDLVAYCIPRDMDLDLRIGDESYKRRWADRWGLRWTYVIAATPLGVGGVGLAKWRGAIRLARRTASRIVRRPLGGSPPR